MKKTWLLGLLATLGASACSSQGPTSLDPGSNNSNTTGGGTTGGGTTTGDFNQPPPVPKTVLDDRVVSYPDALRTASLKLVRNLPTLQQIKTLTSAADQKATYEKQIDELLADGRFTARMIKWWQDTMRQGGGAANGKPSRNTAPTFAARVVVEGRPYTDLFTASTNTCPTYDGATNTFMDGNCDNGVATHAGVLTNPGVMMQFYSNMAFRRVRWVQEVFACTKFPAEYAAQPTQVNGADYTNPWPFAALATTPINFQDTSSVVCANCHSTINRIAPLFANFNADGQWMNSSQVMTPTVPDPLATEFNHWLNAGEPLAWRKGAEVKDLPELGAAMAKDPDVAECAVARMYNFAMSKEDIVSDLATVPAEVIQPYLDEFNGNGMNLKATLRAILVSDDFVKF
ncbi:MAG TPA: DUF1549 domain-containing protein [Polyangium sp.]|jgi:hypothetical protein|nr:DUF1549 domain-containing protein [Polyangium sp.]